MRTSEGVIGKCRCRAAISFSIHWRKSALRPRAGSPGDLAPLLDKDQARDTLNSKAGSESCSSFRINLAETQARLDLGRHCREARSHLEARPAPSSPEID